MFDRYAYQVLFFTLNLSLHPSFCRSITAFSDINRSQFCFYLSGWAERQRPPKAPEWQLSSRWVDLYHACFFKQSTSEWICCETWLKIFWQFYKWLSCFVPLCHRNLAWLLFGHLQDHDGHGGCILRRKILMFNLVFLIFTYSVTLHYHARESKWNHSILISS